MKTIPPATAIIIQAAREMLQDRCILTHCCFSDRWKKNRYQPEGDNEEALPKPKAKTMERRSKFNLVWVKCTLQIFSAPKSWNGRVGDDEAN